MIRDDCRLSKNSNPDIGEWKSHFWYCGSSEREKEEMQIQIEEIQIIHTIFHTCRYWRVQRPLLILSFLREIRYTNWICSEMWSCPSEWFVEDMISSTKNFRQSGWSDGFTSWEYKCRDHHCFGSGRRLKGLSTWHSTFYVLLSTFYILVPNIRQSCRHCILPDSRQRLVWSDASWSPNSTDLYFWYLFVMTLLCQQTNTKDIAGQSAGLMLFVLQIVPDQFHPSTLLAVPQIQKQVQIQI